MTAAQMTTISHTQDEQIAAVRTLLNIQHGGDIVEPLKTLLKDYDSLLFRLVTLRRQLSDIAKDLKAL